ncbi:MAG: hypothetical protein WBQ11_15120, partial [Isosphaeraceae bacterium]
DITAGSNGHRATPGYELATGLGSPRGALLVSDLSNPNVHATIQTASSGTKARASAKSTARPRISDPAMHVTIERISLAMPASSRLSDTARPGSVVESRSHHALSRQTR